MTFFKRLFTRSKPDQEMRGFAPGPTVAEQDNVRSRMEAEVLGNKERRDAKAADTVAKEPTD